jgi:hypothetical protein
MKKGRSVTKIWESRNLILEGIKNSLFKKEAVEAVAKERNAICESCPKYDAFGDSCTVPGTAPCCGACGCSLKLKQRSLASGCDEGYWDPVLTEEEDMNHDILNPEVND